MSETCTVTRAAVEVAERLRSRLPISQVAKEAAQHYGWPPAMATKAVYALSRVGLSRVEVLAKAMELVMDKGISAAQVYHTAAKLFDTAESVVASLAYFIPPHFRRIRRVPSQGETDTVVRPLTREQIAQVNKILDMLSSNSRTLSQAREIAESMIDVRAQPETDAEDTTPEVVVPATAAEEEKGKSTSGDAADSEPSAPPEPDDLLEHLAVLVSTKVPDFDFGQLLGQLGALVRIGGPSAQREAMLSAMKAGNSRLEAEIETLKAELERAEEAAKTRIAAAKEEAERIAQTETAVYSEQLKRISGAYGELRNTAQSFLTLGSLQQIAALGQFRLDLQERLQQFGTAIQEVKTWLDTRAN